MILGLVGAFLIGSIPFSYLLGKFLGKDLRKEGSKNPGATNLYRVCGPLPGLSGLALDIGKGAVGVLFARGESAYAPLFGLAAILGHVFSPFLGFKGGKGVATAAGAFAVLAPGPLAWSLAAFAAALFLTRYMAVASSLAAITLIVSATVMDLDSPRRWTCLGVALLVLVRHSANFKRLLAGKEPKFRISKKA